MRIIALDLGTSTGWAIHEDGLLTSGTQSFKVDRFASHGMKFLRFKRWLTEMKGTGTFDAIYYEEVRRHLSTDASHSYGAFWGHLTAWCEHHGIPYQGVPVGTIKRFGCGKGNGDKQAMIDAAIALGFAVDSDDEADAIHLLRYALSGENACATSA